MARAIDRGGLLRAALPVTALVSIIVVPGATLAVAGDTLGYDFLAYYQAGRRLLDGGPLYETAVELTGEFGFFYYPPQFLFLAVPFALFPSQLATWLWVAFLMAAFLGGVTLLPVGRRVKWAIVLLAGLSWPFAYALKIGQVGPLLFLTFAVGWRWLASDRILGASAAMGAAIKVQPALVLVWAVGRGRSRTAAWGVGVLVALALVVTPFIGLGGWFDYLELTSRASDRATHPQSLSLAALAFRSGASAEFAGAIQLATFVVVLGIVVVGARRAAEAASYVSVVAASQLLTPILWDHYAILVLIPAAYLLSRGWWIGALLPLVTMVPLVGVTPPLAYPVVFALALVAPLIAGRQGAGAAGSGASGAAGSGASGAAGSSA